MTNQRCSQIAICSFAVIATLACGAEVRAQEADDQPPARIRGGLVQQLRSLSEDVLGGIKDRAAAAGDSLTGRRKQRYGRVPTLHAPAKPQAPSGGSVPTQVIEPPEVDYSPPSRTAAAPLVTDNARPGRATSSGSSSGGITHPSHQPLADVVRPEDIGARRSTAAPSRKAPPRQVHSPVHVEASLPDDVLKSISPRRRASLLRRQAAVSPDALGSQVPKVARIPLPGTTRRTPIPSLQAGASPAEKSPQSSSVQPRSNQPTPPEDRPAAAAPQMLAGSSTPPAAPEPQRSAPSLQDIALPSPPQVTRQQLPTQTQASLREMAATPMPNATSAALPSPPSLPPTGVSVPATLVRVPTAEQQAKTNTTALTLPNPNEPEIPADVLRRGMANVSPSADLPSDLGQAISDTVNDAASSNTIAGNTAAGNTAANNTAELPGLPSPAIDATANASAGQLPPGGIELLSPAEISTESNQLRPSTSKAISENQPAQPKALAVTDSALAREPTGTLRTPSAAQSTVALPAKKPSPMRPAAVLPQTQMQPTESAQHMRLETPRMEVALNGPSDLPVGVASRFEIVAKNADQFDLHGLLLQLDIPRDVAVRPVGNNVGTFDVEVTPEGTTLLTWQLDYVKAGSQVVAPVEMTAKVPRNFAVAMEWTLMPVASTADIDVLAPRLDVALEGPSEVQYGQANVYRLHVRNPGNAAAKNVQVKLSAGPYGESASGIGDIAAGQEKTIDVELTFNQKGAIDITAAATASGQLTSDTGIEVIVRKANLAVSIAAPQLVYRAEQNGYRILVENSGDADARGVKATFEIPPGARVQSMPPAARLSGREISWPIDVVSAGSNREYQIQLDLAAAGQHTVKLRCGDPAGELAVASATTYVEAIADLKLIVSDPIAPAPVGSEVVYELAITNRGSKAASNVAVIAQFSEGIEPTRGDGHTFRVIPGQLFFDPIATIDAGKTVVLKVFAKASGAGMHRFRAEVRSAETEARLVQEEATKFMDRVGRIALPTGGPMVR